MKTVQVRFVVKGDEVTYSCLYLENSLREKASFQTGSVSVESCCCPEIIIEKCSGDVNLFLRGSQRYRDEEESCTNKKRFFERLPDILEALLKFDEHYQKEWFKEKKSEIIINGETFSFDTREQEQIIKLLRIKI